MNEKPLREIHLIEWDADIYNLGRGKVGETIEYEIQQRIMIPEDSIQTKGVPRYKVAFLQEDIKKRVGSLIKLHENEIEKLEHKLTSWKGMNPEDVEIRALCRSGIMREEQSLREIKKEFGGIL
jgi:hypothetical protein